MGSSMFMVTVKNFLVSIMVFMGMIFTPSYYKDAKEIIKNIDENTFKSSQTTLAYDKDGNVITKLKDEKDSYYISMKTVPKYVTEMFVATEDKSFYKHNGVDLNGIGRAFVGLVKNGEISGGGSTITQQLVRNVFLTHEKSFERKLKEVYISVLLEKEYTKDEILEYYINTIYFANGAHGIDAASRKYFGKSAAELTLAEATFLGAIPNNPTLYNPITNFDNTIKRQERMLGYMVEDGYITEEEKKKAMEEPIVLKEENISKSNYVDTYVVESATEALMKEDGFIFQTKFSNENEKAMYDAKLTDARKEAQQKLYTKGYRIYTSIDMEKQQLLQNSLDSTLSVNGDKTSSGIYEFQGSAVSIDNSTGRVVAIVGGRTQEDNSYGLNRAFQSYRQPGSTIKPLVVYAPLFENGYYPSTMVLDEKKDGGPKNFNESYDGMVSIRYAVEQSKNTVAWDLLGELGVGKGLSYLEMMNFKKIVSEDYNLAAALGGLTYGTNVLEMASAYSTLARDGKYIKPTCIVKITDADGKVVYEDRNYTVQVYTEKSARIMTDVLKTTMTNGLGQKVQLSVPSAGKTGSTNENKDGWFAGYTPYYTTVVWAGYDTPKSVENLFGSTYPGMIWQSYMNSIHSNLEVKDFEPYANLQAEEETVRLQEEQKVLTYDIGKMLDVYANTIPDSYQAFQTSDTMYYELLDKINMLFDEAKKAEYMGRLSERKSYYDEIKPWYYF